MMSNCCATQGFVTNKDLQSTELHQSIQDLYDTNINNQSQCLTQYYHLLLTFATLICSDKCPKEEVITRFENHTSLYCDNIVTGQSFTTMHNDAPEHLHLLPSILSPQMLYPLIDMNRSNSSHRLHYWAFNIALKRKLRLPISDHQHKCKCGHNHDIFGDHAFHCRCTSKKLAHNIIQDTWVIALQPVIATAGYIHHNSKLDIE
jgi:hypothetical protein